MWDSLSKIGEGLLGAGGHLGGSALSYSLMKKEAKRNRDFQERMARHSHRYEMEDLRKAGLNPILTGKYGGAAAPSGSVAGVPDFGQAASSAMSALRLKNETELIGAQKEKIEKETAMLGKGLPGAVVGERVGVILDKLIDRLEDLSPAQAAATAKDAAAKVKEEVIRSVSPDDPRDIIDEYKGFKESGGSYLEWVRKKRKSDDGDDRIWKKRRRGATGGW